MGKLIVLKALCVCCHNARIPIDMQLSMPQRADPINTTLPKVGRLVRVQLDFHSTCASAPASAATRSLCVMYYCSLILTESWLELMHYY